MSGSSDLGSALAAIDTANTEDPNKISVGSVVWARAEYQGVRATYWLQRLAPEAHATVTLAARAHHLRRWVVDRAAYPDGRVGYHRWKRDARDAARRAIADVLRPAGVEHATMQRVGALVNRDDLGQDADTQLVEDAACLVFLETQFEELIDRLGEEKVAEAVRKTLRKMSPTAIAIAGEAVQSERGRTLLGRVVAETA